MGFFSRYTDEEQSLLDSCVQIIIDGGMPYSEAKKYSKRMLDKVIKESKKEGTYSFPNNMGDIILGSVSSHDSRIQEIADFVKTRLPLKKAAGVKNEDIRWWWNLNDIERRVMLELDDIKKMSLAVGELKNNTEPSEELAMKKAFSQVPRLFPIYGDPDDTSKMSGEDRPLPYELKKRIDSYFEKAANAEYDQLMANINKFSSVNAYIRKEIRENRL